MITLPSPCGVVVETVVVEVGVKGVVVVKVVFGEAMLVEVEVVEAVVSQPGGVGTVVVEVMAEFEIGGKILESLQTWVGLVVLAVVRVYSSPLSP